MDANALAEEYFELIERVTERVIGRWPTFKPYEDDIRSSAGLALVTASRLWDSRRQRVGDTNVRGFLFNQMFWDVLDDLRAKVGRRGSARSAVKMVSFQSENFDDGSEYDRWLEDPRSADAFRRIEDLEAAIGFLASLPNDRYREIALRLAGGETQVEVARRFGVSESMVGNIITKIRTREGSCLSQSPTRSVSVSWT